MPSIEVVEFFQHEVQFPYGVIKRVSAAVGTFFFLSTSLFSYPFTPTLHIENNPHPDTGYPSFCR